MKRSSRAIILFLTSYAFSPAMAGETVTYTYDAFGRLVSTATAGTINNGLGVVTNYDAADNRTNHTVSGTGLSGAIIVIPTIYGYSIIPLGPPQ